MKNTSLTLQNALLVRNCVRLARSTGDEAFLVLSRESPFMSAQVRLALNASESNAPLLPIKEGGFKVDVKTDDHCVLTLENSCAIDFRCITGVFFKKAGLTLPCAPLPQNIPELVPVKNKLHLKAVPVARETLSDNKNQNKKIPPTL